ncbi:MAG: hypothetical protein BMS9Abin29_2550 [Gemmatimonadota bacterium]|nr:MAG: hypothetical protein BMS9Abin29_2550 [Gemmatimonadota bacterium]
MPSSDERVTVTLPHELVADIDRRERNRSRFIREAVRRELERRKREALRVSLSRPHEETPGVGGFGLEEWLGSAVAEDDQLLDPDAGIDVQWTPECGWTRTGEG